LHTGCNTYPITKNVILFENNLTLMNTDMQIQIGFIPTGILKLSCT